MMGAHEVPVRMSLAREWHELLQAPRKELVVIDGAGHRPQFERPTEFVALMRRVPGR
nr:alpha/beta hydrolase [Allorhizocola rhizosphaerae]